MKRAASIIIAVIFFCMSFLGVQRLLTPKYMSHPFEGALTAEYYQSGFRNDLIIIGSCEVYSNISPVLLWEEFGIPAFIRGNPRQLMWHSRVMLEDALRHETPRAVLLSIQALMYGETPHDNEPYNRLVFDGMRLSRVKWRGVQESVLPEESRLSYLFPLLRFHERWRELSREDFRYFFRREPVSVNGFVMRADVQAAGWTPPPAMLPNYEFGAQAIDALAEILRLTRAHDIQLILFKAPSLLPHWHDEWNAWVVDFARQHNLPYLNSLTVVDEIGLDYNLHTFNAGLNLNLAGARLLTHYLGGWLNEHASVLTDRRGEDANLDAVWHTRGEQYRAWAAVQEAEIERYGRVNSVMLFQALD